MKGLASRVAAESWMDGVAKQCRVVECGIGVANDVLLRALVADAPEAIVLLDANLSPLDVYARPLIDMVQKRLASASNADMRPRIVMSMSDSVATLPVPLVVESVALQVSLDRIPVFLEESDAASRLEELADSEEPDDWFGRLWKPGTARLLGQLRLLPSDEAMLALSVLASARSNL